MGIKDILSMGLKEFNKLTSSDLRSLTTKLVSAANKRVKRFELSGEKSPALSRVEQEGKFSIRGKNFNEVRSEFARAKRFLESETGNLRGARRIRTRVTENLAKSGVDISPDQYNRFFDAYEKLKQMSPEVADRRFKYMAMREISNRIEGNEDPATIARQLTTEFNNIYEQQEMEEQELNNVSEFFETEEIL